MMRYRSDTDVMCYVFDLSRASWKNGTEDFEVTLRSFLETSHKLLCKYVCAL